ncbi:hypothetical protein GY15_26535 [Delftia sp. 670]|nr:hypothetical protein GY15_26535 [Delftia sp. 670]
MVAAVAGSGAQAPKFSWPERSAAAASRRTSSRLTPAVAVFVDGQVAFGDGGHGAVGLGGLQVSHDLGTCQRALGLHFGRVAAVVGVVEAGGLGGEGGNGEGGQDGKTAGVLHDSSPLFCFWDRAFLAEIAW